MVKDPLDNFGFAAHIYPGWYGQAANGVTCDQIGNSLRAWRHAHAPAACFGVDAH